METARVVIVSGPPGAGKSTVARKLAEESSYSQAIHLHTDDFYAYIRKGYIPPWKPEAQQQNMTVMEAMTASVKEYTKGGYEVIIDGVVGPWFLEPWFKLKEEFAVYFVVLRPDEATTLARATARKGERALVDEKVLAYMWQQFRDLGKWDTHAIDTTKQTVEETVLTICNRIQEGQCRL